MAEEREQRQTTRMLGELNKLHPSLAKRIASSSHLGGSQDPHEARARPQGSARAWAGPKTAPQPQLLLGAYGTDDLRRLTSAGGQPENFHRC